MATHRQPRKTGTKIMSTQTPVTRDNLNHMMEFDHVIMVHADGTVTDAPADVYAPDCYVESDADGQIHGEPDMSFSGGWSLMTGYTGQFGYRGAIMDASEYIGGKMADDILSAPGYYVALTVTDTTDDESEPEDVGWAVAFKAAP